ncbi:MULTISPECIES: toxin-antitoxin system YwqK family antitoxin [unclassified Saccharopolyspora]|uniref:toxin-antitoxin system YwqK family antitoxin n=1 Tax=unclassified Saccharopolyspora TaxID=2646250 RepID=UPI001CD2B5D1|nr:MULTISPECIES: hypothetical protein [unclassified Saccharopolyspora]MCA1186954.1 hypothetical protein [Saccharopolyspora sp. 6T]MCA1192667.1 hypothetical protein [Saccharopolyspora sp. 6V]MCA1227767.1 hypothetical protein [Saccharopolyspora sp. 6M]MCA1281819.1 hypothetical protein [Saccharopolyspora sp. 7B]
MGEVRVDEDDIEMDPTGLVFHRGEPFTGVVVERSADGELVSTRSYFAGYPDGPYREWRSSGRLRKDGRMRDGRSVGSHREWHANGRLAERREFDAAGNLVRHERWDRGGNLVVEPTGRR